MMDNFLVSTNPLNNEEIGKVKVSSDEDITLIVQSAKKAQKRMGCVKCN